MIADEIDDFLEEEDKDEVDLEAATMTNFFIKKSKEKLPSLRNSLEKEILDKMESR